jgi:cell division protein FtsN
VKRIRSKQISEEQKPEFWFNTKTMSVEVGKQTLALYRIGPFDSFEEAKNALQTLKSRSDAWNEEDNEERK